MTTYYARRKEDEERHIGQTGWAGKTLCGIDFRAEGAYAASDMISPTKHLCAACLRREADLMRKEEAEHNAHAGEVYNIANHAEETYCEYCGFPMFIGEMAYLAPDGQTYCCRTHAREAVIYAGLPY